MTITKKNSTVNDVSFEVENVVPSYTSYEVCNQIQKNLQDANALLNTTNGIVDTVVNGKNYINAQKEIVLKRSELYAAVEMRRLEISGNVEIEKLKTDMQTKALKSQNVKEMLSTVSKLAENDSCSDAAISALIAATEALNDSL